MKKTSTVFSGDSIGYLNIIERAVRLFGQLLAGIGNNSAKKYRFRQEERVVMMSFVLHEDGARHLPKH